MIVLFGFLVLLPAFAGLYWLSRCGAATRTAGRLCYRRRPTYSPGPRMTPGRKTTDLRSTKVSRTAFSAPAFCRP